MHKKFFLFGPSPPANNPSFFSHFRIRCQILGPYFPTAEPAVATPYGVLPRQNFLPALSFLSFWPCLLFKGGFGKHLNPFLGLLFRLCWLFSSLHATHRFGSNVHLFRSSYRWVALAPVDTVFAISVNTLPKIILDMVVFSVYC